MYMFGENGYPAKPREQYAVPGIKNQSWFDSASALSLYDLASFPIIFKDSFIFFCRICLP